MFYNCSRWSVFGKDLEDTGVYEIDGRVLEYLGRMAHEKVAIMGGSWATFGSSNLDARSLVNNDELNMVVNDIGVAEDIRSRLFDVDLKKSERILHYSPDIVDQAASQTGGML